MREEGLYRVWFYNHVESVIMNWDGERFQLMPGAAIPNDEIDYSREPEKIDPYESAMRALGKLKGRGYSQEGMEHALYMVYEKLGVRNPLELARDAIQVARERGVLDEP